MAESSARYERIQTLFSQASDLPDTERRGFLDAECGADDDLIEQVLGMLLEDARGASLLDRDMAYVARRVILPGDAAALPVEDFGPYRITKRLGEGGMGVVYLAERRDLGSLAAI